MGKLEGSKWRAIDHRFGSDLCAFKTAIILVSGKVRRVYRHETRTIIIPVKLRLIFSIRIGSSPRPNAKMPAMNDSPRNTEPQANGALANALKRMHPDWNDETLHAERTNVLQVPSNESASAFNRSPIPSGKGKQPDILIAPPQGQPVIIETEFDPALTVEKDAIGRIGTQLRGTGDSIEGALSVVLPKSLKHGNLDEVENATYRYAAHYLGKDGEIARWPTEQWLTGTVEDIADAIEFVSISPRRIASTTSILETTVRQCAARMSEWAGEPALRRIAAMLHQEEGDQTVRMAAAIFVSAFVFHSAIETQQNVPPVPASGSISKFGLLAIWREILEINYWPVFGIARNILNELSVIAVPRVMDRVADSLSELAKLGTTTYHDLTGRMFQTLISDRKFLATFYTLPESACLLAELALDRVEIDWSDKSAIEKLQVADFACGTGALLSAVQRSIYRRYRRTGGDDKELHSKLMERVLVGLDIMPAATHLTCSILSSCYPALAYGECRIHTMPYGKEAGGLHLGALDFLSKVDESAYSLFSPGETLSGGEKPKTQGFSFTVKHHSCDVVIMNPLFTRPTGHEGSVKENTPVPSFAGFGNSAEDQKAMSRALSRHQREFGNGNAGLASNFMDLAHLKLKAGGILALVLPFAAVQGQAWRSARAMLDKHYSDIHILSIATHGIQDRAFSADTGMAEILVVARKTPDLKGGISFSNLRSRPVSLLDAALTAKEPRERLDKRGIEEAGFIGVASSSVVNAAQSLCDGKLSLPRMADELQIPTIALGEIASRGLYSIDINGAPPRGAFIKRQIQRNEIPEYPSLWNHDAERERRMVVYPDSCCDVQAGYESKAMQDWHRTASRLHWNADFRLNSQSLTMCLTPDKCIGGTAWPNVIARNMEHESALLIWSNTTLGILMHWWKGTRQQSGRSRVKITAIPDYITIDPREFTAVQLQQCDSIFSEFKDKEFLPANEAYRDSARQVLDHAFLCDVLSFPESLMSSLRVLRDQWCAEPSVHGGKATRIQTPT